MPTGVVYHTSFAGTFDLAGINRNGKLAYLSLVEGDGIDMRNDTGLWGGTPGFENLLLREGQRLLFDDRELCTVSNAADQSGLPEGVVRREATVAAGEESGFYRISVSVVPPAQ